MNAQIQHDNFNYKLKRLVYYWQDNVTHNCHDIPLHREFLDMCAILFRRSHEEHIELFEDYLLTGIDNGHFPDKFSKRIQEFFKPLIMIWHEVSGIAENKLPLCEDILILAEALSCCSNETNLHIFSDYGLSDNDCYFAYSQRPWKNAPPMQLRPKDKAELQAQYSLAKKRWKKIPFWVSWVVQASYPYH